MNGCGGALIAPDVVLFAAHCKVQFLDQQFIIGAYKTRTVEYGAQARFCDEWIADPLFGTGGTPEQYTNNNYDFALCKLDEPVYIDDSTVTIVLNEDDAVPSQPGDKLTVMGFGTLEFGTNPVLPTYLQEVEVEYILNDQCNAQASYGGIEGGKLTEAMLCAGIHNEGGKDACQGDSGGPLVRRTQVGDKTVDVHVGVVSWGIGCATENFAGVYARTSKRAGWIKDTMCGTLNSVSEDCAGYRQQGLTTSSADDGCHGPVLTVTLETDRYGRETTWYLEDESRNLIKQRKYFADFHEYETRVCLEYGETYNFEITDSYGDGMCTSAGCGSYTLRVDGTTVIEGNGVFGTSLKAQFTTEEAPVTESPTLAPTPSPTFSPTRAPTSSPSVAPSGATHTPSATPTDSPTLSPTDAPSQSPSVQDESRRFEPEITDAPLDEPPEVEPVVESDPPTLEDTMVCEDDNEFRSNNLTCRKLRRSKKDRWVKKKCKKTKQGKPVKEWCAKTCGTRAGLGPCKHLQDRMNIVGEEDRNNDRDNIFENDGQKSSKKTERRKQRRKESKGRAKKVVRRYLKVRKITDP